MAGRHFEGLLPPGIRYVEEDRIGTNRGNPTSPVLYGFETDEKPPRYAVGGATPLDDDRSVRTAVMVGPLASTQYDALMQIARTEGVEPAIERARTSEDPYYLVVEARIPKHETVERVLGKFTRALFITEDSER